MLHFLDLFADVIQFLMMFRFSLVYVSVFTSDRRIIGFADLKSVRSDKIRRITRSDGRI